MDVQDQSLSSSSSSSSDSSQSRSSVEVKSQWTGIFADKASIFNEVLSLPSFPGCLELDELSKIQRLRLYQEARQKHVKAQESQRLAKEALAVCKKEYKDRAAHESEIWRQAQKILISYRQRQADQCEGWRYSTETEVLELLAQGVYFLYPDDSIQNMQKYHKLKCEKLDRDLAEAKYRVQQAEQMYKEDQYNLKTCHPVLNRYMKKLILRDESKQRRDHCLKQLQHFQFFSSLNRQTLMKLEKHKEHQSKELQRILNRLQAIEQYQRDLNSVKWQRQATLQDYFLNKVKLQQALNTKSSEAISLEEAVQRLWREWQSWDKKVISLEQQLNRLDLKCIFGKFPKIYLKYKDLIDLVKHRILVIRLEKQQRKAAFVRKLLQRELQEYKDSKKAEDSLAESRIYDLSTLCWQKYPLKIDQLRGQEIRTDQGLF